MLRRFKISVDGHEYDVTVEDVADESGLYPDRATMRAAAQPAGATSAAPAAPAAPPAQKAQPAAGPGDVTSPLAGVVLSIDVAMGATVDADTQVVTLEAMKTKSVVKAGVAGTVSAIAVSAGEAVEAGQTLLTVN